MKCKPGDIAYIVAPYDKRARGRVVEVVRLAVDGETCRAPDGGTIQFNQVAGRPAWLCRGNVPTAFDFSVTEIVIADDCLRPIRDPGEDATDESFTWAPSPAILETA